MNPFFLSVTVVQQILWLSLKGSTSNCKLLSRCSLQPVAWAWFYCIRVSWQSSAFYLVSTSCCPCPSLDVNLCPLRLLRFMDFLDPLEKSWNFAFVSIDIAFFPVGKNIASVHNLFCNYLLRVSTDNYQQLLLWMNLHPELGPEFISLFGGADLRSVVWTLQIAGSDLLKAG